MKYTVAVTRTSHETKNFIVEVPDHLSPSSAATFAERAAHERAANTDFNNPGAVEYRTESVDLLSLNLT